MRRLLALLAILGLLAAPAAHAGHFEPPAFTPPQGRLVPEASSCSGAVPVLTADVSAATVICYVPAVGQIIVINGSPYQFSTLTLTLSPTNQAAGANYDVWAVISSGATVLCAEGSLWSSTTARSGTPAFSAGVLANPAALAHCYNGSTDYGSVAADAATYLGSFTVPTATATTVSSQTSGATTLSVAAALKSAGLDEQYYVAVDSGANLEYELVTGGFGTTSLTVTRGQLGTTAVAHSSAAVAVAGGQTAMQIAPAALSGGTSNLLGVWNALNRSPLSSLEIESTANWTYTSGFWRAANNSTANRITWIDGIGQSPISSFYSDDMDSSGTTIWGDVAVGLNSTSGNSGKEGTTAVAHSGIGSTVTGLERSPALIGLNYVQAMEAAGGSTVTFSGGNGYYLLCLDIWM